MIVNLQIRESVVTYLEIRDSMQRKSCVQFLLIFFIDVLQLLVGLLDVKLAVVDVVAGS